MSNNISCADRSPIFYNELEIDCSLQEEYENMSISLLSSYKVGLSIQTPLTIFGIAINVLVLVVFYRLKWFKAKEIMLYWNLVVQLLLASFLFLIINAMLLSRISTEQSSIVQEKYCILAWGIIGFPIQSSSILALLIGVDRLVARWKPFIWLRLGYRYRCIIVGISIAWAIFATFSQAPVMKSEKCILLCVGLQNQFYFWSFDVLMVGNAVITLSLIVVYVIIPVAAQLMLKTCTDQARKSKLLIFNHAPIEDYQRQFLIRVRLMSGVLVIGFLLCTFTQFIFQQIVTNRYPCDEMMQIDSWTVQHCCNIINSYFPFFVWLIEKSFRHQVLHMLNNCLCFLRITSKSQQTTSTAVIFITNRSSTL